MEKLNELVYRAEGYLLTKAEFQPEQINVSCKTILAVAEAFRSLERERNALAAKGLELCREAANIYGKYNATQMPDMDLVDYQTIQEFSDLASKNGRDGES